MGDALESSVDDSGSQFLDGEFALWKCHMLGLRKRLQISGGLDLSEPRGEAFATFLRECNDNAEGEWIEHRRWSIVIRFGRPTRA